MAASFYKKNKDLLFALFLALYVAITIGWLTGIDAQTDRLRIFGKVVLSIFAAIGAFSYFSKWKKQRMETK